MATTEQIIDLMKNLPEDELKLLKLRMDELLEEKSRPVVKRGDRIRAVAGALNVGKVLDPLPSRESIYEDMEVDQ